MRFVITLLCLSLFGCASLGNEFARENAIQNPDPDVDSDSSDPPAKADPAGSPTRDATPRDTNCPDSDWCSCNSKKCPAN